MSFNREFFQEILENVLDNEIKVLHFSSISGGCIHHAQKVSTDKGTYFMKLNKSSDVNMFKTEFAGLESLASAKEINVPSPITYGTKNGQAYLLLEFINSRNRMGNFWMDFGQSLARLHMNHQNDQYGLSYNFIKFCQI
jgi:fructosamine-3-kinase